MFFGQRRPSLDDIAAIPVPSQVYAVVGTTATYLEAPAGKDVLFVAANQGGWSFRPGNYVGAEFSVDDTDEDTVTITGHKYETGDGPFLVETSGSLPTGLTTSTDYYIIKVDENTVKFASSEIDAGNGVAVDITAAGSGTHSISAGMPSTELPASSITNGHHAHYLMEGHSWPFVKARGVTVKGYGATSVLNYFWA